MGLPSRPATPDRSLMIVVSVIYATGMDFIYSLYEKNKQESALDDFRKYMDIFSVRIVAGSLGTLSDDTASRQDEIAFNAVRGLPPSLVKTSSDGAAGCSCSSHPSLTRPKQDGSSVVASVCNSRSEFDRRDIDEKTSFCSIVLRMLPSW